MKERQKNIIRIIALILVVMLVLGVVVSAVVAFAEEETDKDRYTLDMYLHEANRALEVSETLRYTNRTDRTLPYVMFNLYANVYRRIDTLPYEEASLSDAFPDGYAPGGVDFVRITVNGREADWAVQGESEQFLRVDYRLAPGESVEFGFDYYLLLPTCEGALGVGDLDWRLTGFYPIAAIYDSSLEDFALEAYTKIGQCDYSQVADYQIMLNAPATYALASTGSATCAQTEDGRLLWTIAAEDVRDVAISLGRRYTEYARQTGNGVSVRVLSNTSAGAGRVLDAAVQAVELFSEWFGDYPYEELDIVQSNYFLGGISYPGLILIDERLFAHANREELAGQVVNQVAHQWFSGIVGSNASREPWLDEAVCAYVALLYTEYFQGYDAYLTALNRQVLSSLQLTLPGGLTVDSGISRFDSLAEYEIIVIDRGTAVLHELRSAMGADTLRQALRRYAQEMWLQNASIGDFAGALNETSGGRWDEYLVGQMYEIENYASQQMDWYE